jgi:hypothetical protein
MEFAGSTQNVKKNCRKIKSTNQNKKFPKKSMFSSFKVKKSQKFVWGIPEGIHTGSSKNNQTQV